MKILLIAGARPNFMKIAPLVHELKARSKTQGAWRKKLGLKSRELEYKIVHTGQHYDYEMSKVFFEELDIPEPDFFLGAGSGTHAVQTAKIMTVFERVCLQEKPDVVVVVGDVNSTLACSVTAKKLNIKVAHVEAGLRSFDMTMPEEINRIVTDSVSDYLFVSEKSGIDNLKREGKNRKQIFFAGNIMIDTLYYGLKKIENKKLRKSEIEKKILSPELHAPGTMRHADSYAVVTLHRPSNVDDKDKLEDILLALKKISEDMDIYFPVHPRTEKNINDFKLNYLLEGSSIKVTPPLSYLEFLSLWRDAALVLTDSGGIQEETTVLGIPCFTIRENTERPVTIKKGTNVLVGTNGKGILKAYKRFKKGRIKKGRVPKYWDGKTAQRIVKILIAHK
ncbi:MAG: UDP-N-acetylglucosamine 2-epimerase [Nitrospirae bacterium RBG_13_39_12]|nr:MAG: UDP-N-acetylglucosamine 2-epimerase [Nitrospirae bacterium RBG_13_39_12]